MRSLPGHLRIALALLALAVPASAATITVDKNKGQTIQSAIDVAVDGDIVLVSPGTYFEHIDFKGKDILVTSTLSTDQATIAAATNATVIDGGSTGPAVTSSADESEGKTPMGFSGFEISYFTIQHGGSPTPGLALTSYGGIYMPHSGFAVIGNIITHNNFGGISLLNGGFAEAVSNTITENTCWGIVTLGIAVVAENNEISATQTPATGCTITDARGTFSTNSSGILLDGEPTKIANSSIINGNTIESNDQLPSPGAPVEGGAAIAIYGGDATIQNNIIRNNSAPFARGGAIDIVGGSSDFGLSSSAAIVENLIYKNQAGCGGAAIAFDLGNLDVASNSSFVLNGYAVVVANNTIADNAIAADTAGACPNDAQTDTQVDAGQQGLASPAVLFVNNIISGGASTTQVTNCHQQPVPSIYNQAVFDHNLFFNAGGAIFGSFCVDESVAPLNDLFGNIVADPQFMNRDRGDYSLASSSPGIDAGNNGMVLTLDTLLGDAYLYDYRSFASYPSSTKADFAGVADFAGNPRVQDATGKLDGTDQESDVIDIGAYELAGIRAANNPLTLTILNAGSPTNPGPATLTAYISGGIFITTGDPPLTQTIVPSGTITFFVDGTQAVDPTPITSIQSPLQYGDVIGVAYGNVNFTPGVHVLTATYQPAPKVDATQSVALVVDIVDTPASLSLAAYPYYTSIGSPVTFTVTEQPAYGGSFPSPISILDHNSNVVLGTVDPDPVTGIGTLTTANLIPGYNVVQASFAGGGDYPPSVSNEVSVEITSPTALTLTSDLNPAQAFIPFNLTATFSASATTPASGFVTFYAIRTQPGSFGQAIGRADIANGSATRPVSLAAGTYNLTAVYAGDAQHGASTSPPVPETVVGLTTTLTLTSALNPATAFQPVPLTAYVAGPATATVGNITGIVTFLSNGQSIGTAKVGTDGSAILDLGFSPGTYTLTANYSGDNSFAASTSASVTEVVGRGSTVTSVAATPNPGYTPGLETIQSLVTPAALTSGSVPAPTGTVAFFDGGNLIATLPFDNILKNGAQADFSASNLTVGVHLLTAIYRGDSNYLPSTSGAVTLNVLLSDFTIATDSSLTIQTEHHKNLNVTLASLGNFADNVVITCGNLPVYASCNFPRGGPRGTAALTVGATQTVAIDINTDVAFNFLSTIRPAAAAVGPKQPAGAIALALLFPIALFGARRRFKLHARGAPAAFLAVPFALLALANLSGCSGHQPDHTLPGTYTIAITGTGSTTHVTHTATVILVVTE